MRWIVGGDQVLAARPSRRTSRTLASVRAQISIMLLDAAHGRRRPTTACSMSAARLDAAGGGSAAAGRCALDPGQERKDVLVAEGLGEEIEGPQLAPPRRPRGCCRRRSS